MIEVEDVLEIHQFLIEKYGGANGIREISLLHSAISRPFTTFDGKELYPHPIDKASAILESIIINHPFVDGNKRTAFILCAVILLEYNYEILGSQKEKYDFVIAVTKGELKFDKIKVWLQSHSKKII